MKNKYGYERNKKVKPFYNPPHLLVKQAAAITIYALLTGWNKKDFLHWVFQLKNLLHAGAGAQQISCFGLNPHVVWEMTDRCNLKCIHCHASGGEALYDDELSEAEGRTLIDQIASLGIRSFVFTGGEPLLREDLFDLIAYAKSKGFNVFIATNGTLITGEVATLLRKYNVGVVIGLDGLDPEIHDSIRGVIGAFDMAIEGIAQCIAQNLYVHLNIVASRLNFDEIERVIAYGNNRGIYSYFIYNFIPCGRGKGIREYALDIDEFKALLDLILTKQRDVRAILIPVAAPEYWARMLQRRGIRSRPIIKILSHFFGGCLAGKGMLYIKPNGDVLACPFLSVPIGDVREDSIEDIWRNLETSDTTKGECTRCIYAKVCGGCKARMQSRDLKCPLKAYP